jgi:hypothetical protein
MVIRVLAVPDSLDLPSFDEVFRSVLGWEGLGYIFRVHGQEFNSFRRRTKSKRLREFQLRPQEKFLCTCGAIDLWEWESLDRVADLLMDLDLIRKHSAPAEKLSVGLAEFETYIRNNRESIPNFGERYRQGETIQHGVRRINDQPGGEPAVREAAADALDPTGCAFASATADRGAKRRTRRCLSGMVPVIPGSRSSCCVTHGLLLLSRLIAALANKGMDIIFRNKANGLIVPTDGVSQTSSLQNRHRLTFLHSSPKTE